MMEQSKKYLFLTNKVIVDLYKLFYKNKHNLANYLRKYKNICVNLERYIYEYKVKLKSKNKVQSYNNLNDKSNDKSPLAQMIKARSV
jgi:hypothetical protein